jgi:hypothetical protein
MSTFKVAKKSEAAQIANEWIALAPPGYGATLVMNCPGQPGQQLAQIQ